ncbi:MAG: NAD(P)H-hydrate dehydratase [Candidatus Aenigmarchaeota archaeon ex4484_52]|nr:MAG: NAD(P)H-hydrate dehydratase [Candidatus Aenigmarchaeota archaeon ex4484_52]
MKNKIISLIKNRKKTSHKGENGKLLIVGGSPNYVGAPVLSALAAIRCGIDLAVIATETQTGFAINSYSPNLIVWKFKKYNKEAINQILNWASSFDVVLIGNGLGKENIDFAVKLIETIKEKYKNKKLVIDAEAIKALKKAHLKSTKNIIATPHKKEFEYLIDKYIKDIDKKNYKKKLIDFCKEFKGVVVLKGKEDLICKSKEIKINKTGNCAMSVGGTGDVLAGIISALFCISNDDFNSAKTGAYICGKIGDLAFSDKSFGLIATDIIEKIPEAMFG